MHSNLFLTGLLQKKKMIKKLDVAVLANEDIVFFDEDSGNVTFSSYEMVNLMQILITSTLMMLILIKMILKLLFMLDVQFGIQNFKNKKYLK